MDNFMTISERVAFLKGLAEGMALDPDAKETKITNAVIETLADMAAYIESIDEDLEHVVEDIEDINEELRAIDDYIFDDDDDFDDFGFLPDDDDECGHNCACCGEGDFTLEVDCPACGGEIEIGETDLLSGLAACSACGEKLEFEYDEPEGDIGIAPESTEADDKAKDKSKGKGKSK